MRRAALPAIVLVASAAGAAAAPAVTVRAVHTDVSEARACLPVAGGGALIGTGGGLVRVDRAGAVTGAWTASDGLPGTRIEAIARLGDELWLGTDGGAARISLADGLTVTRAITSRPVRALAKLGGTIYVATGDGGVRELGASKPIPFRGQPATGPRTRASALAIVGGTLYAGTGAGLYRLAGGRLEAVAVDGLAAGAAIAALRADGETLWIATNDGLFARSADGSVRALGGGDLRAIAIVGDEVVVAGIADGLARVDRGRLVGLAGAPRELAVAETVATADGAVCAGGLAGAWLRPSADAAWVHVAHHDGPPSNDITTLAVDGERLWVGTFDHGVAVRDHGTWRTIEHDAIDARVNAILVEPRGGGQPARIWIATANGLSSIDGDDVTRLSRREGLPGRGVLSLARLRDGRMLAGTSYGPVIVTDGRPARLGPKATAIGAVWAAAEDADGALWLGTTTGVYRGREGDDQWRRFSLATGELGDDWVTALVAAGSTVYAGTYKGGVARFDVAADGAISARHVGAGWINPGGLALDGTALRASTMEGLRVLEAERWTSAPGLPGKDTTATARVGATLYVATRRGLAELR